MRSWYVLVGGAGIGVAQAAQALIVLCAAVPATVVVVVVVVVAAATVVVAATAVVVPITQMVDAIVAMLLFRGTIVNRTK